MQPLNDDNLFKSNVTLHIQARAMEKLRVMQTPRVWAVLSLFASHSTALMDLRWRADPCGCLMATGGLKALVTRRHHRHHRTIHIDIDPSTHYMKRNRQLGCDPSTTPPPLHAGTVVGVLAADTAPYEHGLQAFGTQP